MMVLLQAIAVCVIFIGCCALAYGVLRLRHRSARLYWADLVLAALFVVFVATLFLVVNVVWMADLGRIGVGGLSLIAIYARLRGLDPRLRRAGKLWFRNALADASLAHRLHHIATLVHWHA